MTLPIILGTVGLLLLVAVIAVFFIRVRRSHGGVEQDVRDGPSLNPADVLYRLDRLERNVGDLMRDVKNVRESIRILDRNFTEKLEKNLSANVSDRGTGTSSLAARNSEANNSIPTADSDLRLPVVTVPAERRYGLVNVVPLPPPPPSPPRYEIVDAALAAIQQLIDNIDLEARDRLVTRFKFISLDDNLSVTPRESAYWLLRVEGTNDMALFPGWTVIKDWEMIYRGPDKALARQPLSRCFEIESGPALQIKAPAWVARGDPTRIVDRGILSGA